jgi:hypothetical protein
VTLNGQRLFYGDGFTINNEELVLTSGVIGPTDVVAVTLFTNSTVPAAMAFRIFQDMRQVQATYRMTPATTTMLTQDLSITDDVIYVENVQALPQPQLNLNIWGVITVNGERIMYREVDTVLNTVSSLLRGTGGTAVDYHASGSIVYNAGRGNLAPAEYQDKFVGRTALADGTALVYVADNVDLSALDPNFAEQAILVYVGGTYQTSGYTVTSVAPATVTFDQAPTDGVEVTIGVRQGLSWYEPGNGTASNGIPLQEQTTVAAEFFKGE